jgi:hypothetical protein
VSPCRKQIQLRQDIDLLLNTRESRVGRKSMRRTQCQNAAEP